MAGPWERYQTEEAAPTAGPWDRYGFKGSDDRPAPDWYKEKYALTAQTADEAMAGPEGQKLAGELRNKADRMLLEAAGAESPVYAGLSSAANTAFLNVPRNIKAGLMSLQSGKPFEREYAYVRDVDEAAARQSPWAAGLGTAAGVAGQVAALPVAPAASLAGRAAQGAAIGGGVSGVSELADTKDIRSAGLAALGGAALGGIAPPALEGLALGAGAAARAVGGPVRALANADAEAARRVSGVLSRDAAIGGQQLDESALRAAQAAGQPAVVADMGGETTRALARSAANTSPEARAALSDVANRRFESQAPRISEFVMGLGGGQDALSARETLKAQAARANRPAYAKAFAQGGAGAWHEGLAQIAQAPVVADAIKGATRTGANKAAAEGFRPVKNPFVTLESGEVALRDPNVKPTLQFWDAVKRNLDDKIGALQRSGENSAARDAVELRRQLVDYMDQDFPAYKQARAGAAAFFGAEDALDAGEKFVSARGKNSEYARVIAKMSEPERKLFADGFASKLAQQIGETGDRRSVLNSIFQSPAARERVTMALGPQKAKEFEAFMRVEGLMDSLRTAVQGNSTTTRQLIEAGLAGGVGGYLSADNFSAGAMLGAIARVGKMRIDARVARRVGEILASGDPVEFQRLAKMAAKSSTVMDFIKKADARLGAAFSGAGESVGERIVSTARGVAGQAPARADGENAGEIPAVRRQ
jgi:hypothetical protein